MMEMLQSELGKTVSTETWHQTPLVSALAVCGVGRGARGVVYEGIDEWRLATLADSSVLKRLVVLTDGLRKLL